MRTDGVMTIFMVFAVMLMLLYFLAGVFDSGTAQAVPQTATAGRYQISSWATGIGTYGYHTGYYVVDTTTGKVVDSRDDAHDITADIPKTIPGQPAGNIR